MWLKKSDGSYVNTESNATLAIAEISGNWRILLNNTGAPVATGYTTQESAQTALDSFMSEQGHETIPNGS
jgi:hypothetical protein